MPAPSNQNPSNISPTIGDEVAFSEVVRLIAASREKAIQAVNTALIDLYWQIGATISRKIEAAEWGDGVVDRLAHFIARTEPGLRGFTRRNLFRMKRFYEAYREIQSCRHWWHNCRNLIISSSWGRANARKNVKCTACRPRAME